MVLPLVAPPEDGSTLTSLLTSLAAVLIAARVMSAAAVRMGQPAVLGELLAGILLGPSLLGLLDPTQPVIHALSEVGVIILLFQIGLHTRLEDILAVRAPATIVGVVGVVLPFVGGYYIAQALGVDSLASMVCGAALTATSIGISARVLSDLGQLETTEGRIVLGAAVFDDIVGLIILSVVSGLAAGGVLNAAGIGRTAAAAIGFLVAALVLGRRLAPGMMRLVTRLRVEGSIGSIGLAFAFALAALAAASGSAMIIGAFAAGLILHQTPEREKVEESAIMLGHFFVPVFFLSVGASIDVHLLANLHVLLVGGLLSLVAILGKLLSGFAPWWLNLRRTMIGVAMIPRGEVGLIFAQMGLASGALDEGLFSAVILMVMVTTFIAPPWLAALARRAAKREP